MAEEYVSRNEFEQLKKEVAEIKKSMSESEKLLQEIDKKIDIINEKIVTSEKIDELKINPIQKEIDSIKDSNKWLWRTIAGTIIGLIINYILKFPN